MMILLACYRRSPAVLVGTDILHAVILLGVTGLIHLGLGTVDLPLVGWLLLGSLPGTYLGTRLTTIVPGRWLRAALLISVVGAGIKFL